MKHNSSVILVPMDSEELGLWLCYKYNMKFNYYLFVGGINVLITFIMLLGIAICWFFAYQIDFPDPLLALKKTYLNWEFITIFIISLSLIGASIFSKNKDTLRRNLIIILIITIISFIELTVVKCNLDNTYNDAKFEELYETEIVDKNTDTYYKFDIKTLTINEKGEKDKYIEQMKHEYNKFAVKVVLGKLLLAVVAIFNVYMLIKVQQKIDSINKLNKDDVVVYDEKVDVTTGGYMTFEEYKKMREKNK